MNFGDDLVGWEAAAFASNKRNHAIGAAAVAAVLNFECGSSVIPFSAENGRGEKGLLLEDVAGENFCGRAQKRKRVAVQRCGWNEAISDALLGRKMPP